MNPKAILALTLTTSPAFADPAIVERINATKQGGDWRFDVTLSHVDTGWDDYADGWRVELQDGTVLATRTLLHPHVNEQPFTRSQSGVVVPEGTSEVFIRASTNVDGWDDETTAFAIAN